MSALRLVLAVTACVLAPAASTARDLPRGTFLLAGDVFPAVQDGTISPVFAHVRTGGDRLDWTFFTVFQPNEDICRDLGRCRSFVPALGHRVAWDDDGTLRVLETRRDLGADMTVTYPANDGPHVLAAISGLLDGGRLALTAEGGRIEQRGRRSAGRTVDLLPATLDQAESALAYALALYAKSKAPLGMVSALRETSVVFAAMIGLIWFGERPVRPRLIAAAMVAIGIVMLALA